MHSKRSNRVFSRSWSVLKMISGSPSSLLFIIAMSVGGGLLVIPQSILFSTLIAQIPTRGLVFPTLIKIWCWLGAVILLRGMCRYGGELRGAHLGEFVKKRLRDILLNRMMRLEEKTVHETSTSHWIQTLYSDVENVVPLYRQVLPQILTAVVVPCAILVTLLFVDWMSTTILLITLPLMFFFLRLFGWMAKAKTEKQFNAIHQLGNHFYDVMSGLTVLKWFNRSKAQAKTIAKAGHAYRVATMETLRIAFLSSFSLELIATLGTAMVAVGAGIRLLNGALSYTNALTAILLAGEFYMPLRAFSAQFHASMQGLHGLMHIHSILTEKSVVPKPLPRTPNRPDDSEEPIHSIHFHAHRPIIRLENVTFRYPEGPIALDQVCMSVQPGERVAIIGPSGSGKSTLASVLLGLHRPQAGTVTVFGEPLTSESIPDWRRKVAYVGPHPHLFCGSILDNLRIGNKTADVEEIQRISLEAGVAEFVERLPQGYETRVGSGGMPLSSGQIQRIALARALLKACPVWLLDEPTTHLDTESEHWFMKVLRSLPSAQTVLLISHRKQPLELANKVILIRNGRIDSILPSVHADEFQEIAPS